MPRKFDEANRKRDCPWLIGNKNREGKTPWNKGKTGIYTKERLEQLRNAKVRLGKKNTNEMNASISRTHKGKVVSMETRQKMSLSKRGRKLSVEHKEKLTINLGRYNGKKGENSNFWKGGITKLSATIKSSTKYKEWRLYVFNRDNFLCTSCGSSKKLEVHHIKAFSVLMKKFKNESTDQSYESALNFDPFWDTDNATTLCRECHSKTDNYLHKSKQP